MSNGSFSVLASRIETTLAEKGIEGVSEKELLVLGIYRLGKVQETVSAPFWKSWSPKEIVTGVVAFLVAIGVIGSASATAALRVLGG